MVNENLLQSFLGVPIAETTLLCAPLFPSPALDKAWSDQLFLVFFIFLTPSFLRCRFCEGNNENNNNGNSSGKSNRSKVNKPVRSYLSLRLMFLRTLSRSNSTSNCRRCFVNKTDVKYINVLKRYVMLCVQFCTVHWPCTLSWSCQQTGNRKGRRTKSPEKSPFDD